ncbi:MAG: hypothetical protein JSR77_15105 [Planctomycetes bacterium]|nr:hypothetical protein [Planctomycetota bacterium]
MVHLLLVGSVGRGVTQVSVKPPPDPFAEDQSATRVPAPCVAKPSGTLCFAILRLVSRYFALKRLGCCCSNARGAVP